MRVEIGGAQVTGAMVDVLDTLQNQPEVLRGYTDTVARLTRLLIVDAGDVGDAEAMALLRCLQLMLADLRTLASPPDLDDPANDIPAASL